MFHRALSGVKAYNLDPFFLNGDGLRAHLAYHAGALTVMEGAMGYYDGIGSTCESSAHTVACETRTPVVLVVNARGAVHAAACGACAIGCGAGRSVLFPL
ncbi:MAG: hypothetical protein FWG37_04675 [Clostridia bacterium]|nr:hypothetical protein [Clostridia bacterium]